MVDHNEYYSNYWWLNEKDDMLRVILIAAPMMAVFGSALLAYRIYSRRASSSIYTPCSSHATGPYAPVYGPTTCDLRVCDGKDPEEGGVSAAVPVSDPKKGT